MDEFDKLQAFLDSENELDARMNGAEMGLEVDLYLSTGELLSAMRTVALASITRAQNGTATKEAARLQLIEQLALLHDQGIDVTDLEPRSDAEQNLQFMLLDAVTAISSYRFLQGTNADDKIIDTDWVNAPLSALFEDVSISGDDPEFWLNTMRMVMPQAKILGDSSVHLDQVLADLLSAGLNLEAEDLVLKSQIGVDSKAVEQALKELMNGENDAKVDVVYSLMAALLVRRERNIPDDDFESYTHQPPIGISDEMFVSLLKRAVEIRKDTL
jgi:hypothetical protein